MTKRLASLEGLLMRPRPEADESWPGYLCRLADRNALFGIQGLARVSGISKGALLRGRLASESPGFALEVPNVSKDVAWRPLEVGPTWGARICPICVEREDSVCKAGWDGPLSLRCARHGCMLIDRCDECRKEISHDRPSLMSCACGKRFRTLIARDIPPWVMAMESAYVEAIAPSEHVFTDIHRAAAKAVRFFSLFSGTLHRLGDSGYLHHVTMVRSTDFDVLEKAFGESALGFSMAFETWFKVTSPERAKYIQSRWQVNKFDQIRRGLDELRTCHTLVDAPSRDRTEREQCA